jgi:hypothetical protein
MNDKKNKKINVEPLRVMVRGSLANKHNTMSGSRK